jgi:NCS1 family nucleobase:cation symporter-1
VRSFFTPGGVYGWFAWRGLLAYAVGLGVEFPFVSQLPYYTGPMVARLGGADVSWIIGFTIAAALYAALAWPARLGSAEPAAAAETEAVAG